VLDINWDDAHLWCETTISDPLEIVAKREAVVSRRDCRPRRAQHPVDVESHVHRRIGRGPYASRDWLELDPVDNCVWLKGTEKGPVIDGREPFQNETAKLTELREKAKHHYTAMYDSPTPSTTTTTPAPRSTSPVAVLLYRSDLPEEIGQREAHISAADNL
jgi:hypothetical protein